ncbi:Uncharacterised protein [Vibrio cholerae]|nr:Uncharacterised protein [Vibrio cholerae]CSC83332.1 Uncharacterised protein [Vibrio cholerae]
MDKRSAWRNNSESLLRLARIRCHMLPKVCASVSSSTPSSGLATSGLLTLLSCFSTVAKLLNK